MKPSIIWVIMLVFLLTACSQVSGELPTATLDLQATVDAAVISTNEFQSNLDSTVDASVQSTLSSLPPTSTPAPTAVVIQMSEEELAALIEETVDEAIEASTATTTATTQATSDGTITEEEIEYVYNYIYWADEALYYAEYLIEEYEEYYGEYADEAISVLIEMEEDLETISNSINEIEEILIQGSEAASTAIEMVNQAAQQAQSNLETIEGNISGWKEMVEAGLDIRVENSLNVQPNEIAGDLNGTINQMHDFLDAVKSSITDNKISPDELLNISQLAANANASLSQFGTPRLKEKSANITAITEQFARGQIPQIQASIPEFELDLPPRPSR